MGKTETPSTPQKNTGAIKFGDRTIGTSSWNGNDYMANFEPTAQEQKTFDLLNEAQPKYYENALDKDGAYSFAKKYEDNQIKNYNKAANENLTALKDSLVTGGQVGGSTGWNKIKAFTDSYSDTLSNITAQAPQNALGYQSSLLGLADNVNSSIGKFYNTGTGFATGASNLQQQGWGQNKDAFNMDMQVAQMDMMKQQQMMNNIYGGVSAVAGLASGAGNLATGIGSLSKKTGGTV